MKCSGCGQDHGPGYDRGMSLEMAAKIPRVPPERRGQLWFATFAADFKANMTLLLAKPWDDLKAIETACFSGARADIAVWALGMADEMAREPGWRTPADIGQKAPP